MLNTLLENAVLSFRAPRKGARAIIDMVSGWDGVALIFGLAFTLTAILTLLGVSIADRSEATGDGMQFVVTNLIFSLVAFAFSTGLIFGIGKLFGGKGELLEVATIMAWHSLITVAFTPFISLEATMEGAGPAAIFQFILMGVALWLLVNFITEAHRFESAWRVGAVMMGGVFVAGLLLPIIAFAAI